MLSCTFDHDQVGKEHWKRRGEEECWNVLRGFVVVITENTFKVI